MRFRVFLPVLLGAVVLVAVPDTASSQSPTVEQLATRVRQLERRVEELEQRLRSVESQNEPPVASQARSPMGNWREIDNWRRLRVGMTMDQVSNILGRPEKVDAGISLIHWYWGFPGGGSVFFDSDTSKLRGWSEPSR